MLLKSKIFTRGYTSVSASLRPIPVHGTPVTSPHRHTQVRYYAARRTTSTPQPEGYSAAAIATPVAAAVPSNAPRQPNTIAIAPREYIHVYDTSTNISRVEVGPKNFVRKENERVIEGPLKMVNVLPGNYAKILNPVKQTPDGKVVFDEYGQAETREGIYEYRFEQKPFPLYPGEVLAETNPLKVIDSTTALKLFVIHPHEAVDPGTGKTVQRTAGQEWLFRGPGIYKPRAEEEIKETVSAHVVKPHQALKLRAKRTIEDDQGIAHHPGEEWLMRVQGAYIPDVNEEVVETRNAIPIPDNKAIHMRALHSFTDIYGKKHALGEHYLITPDVSPSHITDVHEEFVGWTDLITLQDKQYCIITNPVDPSTGKNLLGKRKLVVGETFFQQPGELHSEIKNAYILTENEALRVKARENFEHDGIKRQSGDEWLVFGPREFIPPLQVEVQETRNKIILPENRSAYILDHTNGQIRTQTGTFFLKVTESLWEKKMESVDNLLHKGGKAKAKSTEEKYLQVTHVVPQNEVVQIYDSFTGIFRYVVGPDIAKLGPSEEFIVAEQEIASGTLTRPLGPQRLELSIPVETLDHTKLLADFSVTWHFDVDKNSTQEELAKVFREKNIKDTVTSTLGARARQTVSEVTFPAFNAHWSTILNDKLLGDTTYCDPNSKLTLSKLNVVRIDPIDKKTKEMVEEAVQRTVILTTEATLVAAKHTAELTTNQEKLKAEATIDAMRSANDIKQEQERNTYWELKSKNAKMESDVVMAQAQVQAAANIFEARETALAEAEKFTHMVNALGPDTLKAIAQSSAAGDMVKGLGLKGFLLTDGKTPINLIDTAQRMFSDITQNTLKNDSNSKALVEVD